MTLEFAGVILRAKRVLDTASDADTLRELFEAITDTASDADTLMELFEANTGTTENESLVE